MFDYLKVFFLIILTIYIKIHFFRFKGCFDYFTLKVIFIILTICIKINFFRFWQGVKWEDLARQEQNVLSLIVVTFTFVSANFIKEDI